MNNDNDLNLNSMAKLSGCLRYWMPGGILLNQFQVVKEHWQRLWFNCNIGFNIASVYKTFFPFISTVAMPKCSISLAMHHMQFKIISISYLLRCPKLDSGEASPTFGHANCL